MTFFFNIASNLDIKSEEIIRAAKLPSHMCKMRRSGPSCSKLTMLLVNDSLKFTSSDTQIC